MQNTEPKIIQICTPISRAPINKPVVINGESYEPLLWALVEYPDGSRAIEPAVNEDNRIKTISSK